MAQKAATASSSADESKEVEEQKELKLDLSVTVYDRIISTHISMDDLFELNRKELHHFCIQECRLTTKEYLTVHQCIKQIKGSTVHKESVIHRHQHHQAVSGSPHKGGFSLQSLRREDDPTHGPGFFLRFSDECRWVGWDGSQFVSTTNAVGLKEDTAYHWRTWTDTMTTPGTILKSFARDISTEDESGVTTQSTWFLEISATAPCMLQCENDSPDSNTQFKWADNLLSRGDPATFLRCNSAGGFGETTSTTNATRVCSILDSIGIPIQIHFVSQDIDLGIKEESGAVSTATASAAADFVYHWHSIEDGNLRSFCTYVGSNLYWLTCSSTGTVAIETKTTAPDSTTRFSYSQNASDASQYRIYMNGDSGTKYFIRLSSSGVGSTTEAGPKCWFTYSLF